MRYFIAISTLIVVAVLALVTFTAPNRAALGAESSDWAKFHPEHYASYLLNEQVFEDKHPDYPKLYSYVDNYPGLQIIWDGIAFSEEYNKPRGHIWSVEDVENISRPKPGAVCYACKSADCAELYLEGAEGWETITWDEAVSSGTFSNPVGCIDCHDPLTHERRISRTYLLEAIDRQGLGDDFVEANFQSLLCAQCHVEYFFKPGGTLEVTLPWDRGFSIDNIAAYFESYQMPDGSVGYTDFYNPTVDTELVKIQHPEFEVFKSAGTNPHDRIGMTCIDCHMPMMELEGKEIRSHWWTSPLRHVEESCASCHADTDQIYQDTKAIQAEIKTRQGEILELLAEVGLAIEAAQLSGYDENLLEEAKENFKNAVLYWDFIAAENSYGFHNPSEARRVFNKAEEFALLALELVSIVQ